MSLKTWQDSSGRARTEGSDPDSWSRLSSAEKRELDMRLPRKTVYALLLFLLGLNLIARYPRTPHELGFDGFVYHGMTASIIQRGYAEWILTPFSYFGQYPLSHPSGSFFFLADLAQLGGTPIEATILFFDMSLVALGLLCSFVLAMEIRRDEGLGLIVAALFSLSPRFVSGLLWEIPTRALFSALVPLLIWLLLRLHRTRDKRSLGFVVLVLTVMMSAHRLTVLMAAVFIAFILTEIVTVGVRTLRIRYASFVLKSQFRRTANLVVLVGFFVLSISLVTLGGILSSYGTGRAGFGSGVVFELSNLGVSLARSAGFLIPIVPIGVVAVYRQRLKDFKEPFLLMILLVLLPTLTLRQYTGYYIIAVTAPFTGLGIWWIVGKLKQRVTKIAFVSAALAVTLWSANYVLAFDLQAQPFMDDETYVHGLYVLWNTHGTVVGNDGTMASEIYLVSGHPYLPVGGATTPFQSPELLIFGFVNKSALSIIQVPVSDLTLESDSPFLLQSVQAEADWATLLDHLPQNVPGRIWQTYSPQYLAENKQAAGGYFAYGRTYPSAFITSVHAGSYRIFDNGGESLWYIGGLG